MPRETKRATGYLVQMGALARLVCVAQTASALRVGPALRAQQPAAAALRSLAAEASPRRAELAGPPGRR